MRWYFFVPIILLVLIIPGYTVFSSYIGYGLEPVYLCTGFITIIGKYCPAVGLLWEIWILQFYIEDNGREISYIYAKNKWGILRIFLYFYCFIILIPIVGFMPFVGIDVAFYTYFWLCILSFWFYAFVYLLSYILNSVTLTIIPISMYVFFILNPINQYAYRYSYMRLIYPVDLGGLIRGIIFLILAVGVCFLGKLMNKRYVAYP